MISNRIARSNVISYVVSKRAKTFGIVLLNSKRIVISDIIHASGVCYLVGWFSGIVPQRSSLLDTRLQFSLRLEWEMIIQEKIIKNWFYPKNKDSQNIIARWIYVMFGFPPLPATVTTRIITCSLGSLQTPSFASVTGEGGIPYMWNVFVWIMMPSIAHSTHRWGVESLLVTDFMITFLAIHVKATYPLPRTRTLKNVVLTTILR